MPDTFVFPVPSGLRLVVHRWLPTGEPRAVVQIAHGASEHAARYARLAGELTAAGFAVYADDHRGHGRTAGTLERFGVCSTDVFNGMVDDELALTAHLGGVHPGLPVVFVGHSMGSFIAQAYIQRHGDRLAGAVLTGTAGSPSEAAEGLRERLEEAIGQEGRDVPSMVFASLFAEFNDPFVEPAPPDGVTGFEWLSRDQDEVLKYVEDPWCGAPLSNGFCLDLAVGLDEIWAEGAEGRIPTQLPVLVMAGDRDPVGRDGQSVRELTQRYRDAGLTVTEHLYPEARHEVFNESNRDEVHHDLVTWVQAVLARA